VWHWIIAHFLQETGTSSSASRAYNFWSGFGSDIGELAIVGGLVSVYRQHNCHTKGCWRLGKHPVDGTPWRVCRRCHPTIADKAPTRAAIHADHQMAQQ
jgi:hypothetical protein